MNSESFLSAYGYTVSKNANLSDKDRQELLAEIIDLGIATKKDIIQLLDTFITAHLPQRHYRGMCI